MGGANEGKHLPSNLSNRIGTAGDRVHSRDDHAKSLNSFDADFSHVAGAHSDLNNPTYSTLRFLGVRIL
jgi:hypothetical protein